MLILRFKNPDLPIRERQSSPRSLLQGKTKDRPIRRNHKFRVRTDARDAAMACRKAIETEAFEPGPYNIAGAQIVLDA